MKKITLLSLTMLISLTALCQLKTKVQCTFDIDILDGTINKEFTAKSNSLDIKTKFPCFTADKQEDSIKCGERVIYPTWDIYFYSQRKYVEIGEKFKGTLSIPIMGTRRNSLFNRLGNPAIKDADWDAYTTAYGCLILYYNKAGLVNKIQFSTDNTSSIHLCE